MIVYNADRQAKADLGDGPGAPLSIATSFLICPVPTPPHDVSTHCPYKCTVATGPAAVSR